MTLADDVWALKSIRHGAGFTHERETLDRVIAILEPLAGLSDATVDVMITQTSNLAHSWEMAAGHALTDTEHMRCGAIASGYAALAASLTALRGKR